jgi:hypothetical protein
MIYKIRVILDAKEDVFRDLAVDSNDSLEDFHNIISQSFGLDSGEMAAFYTCDQEWNQEDEIPLFAMEDGVSMASVTLKDIIDEDKTKLIYVYDFLLMWTFFVELADISKPNEGASYPDLLFSHGELPDTPPEKVFEAEASDDDFDDSREGFDDFDDYDPMDYDNQWN